MGKNEKLVSYAQDILEGIDYIHDQNIVHADIKLENVLMMSSPIPTEIDLVKVCDFGLS